MRSVRAGWFVLGLLLTCVHVAPVGAQGFMVSPSLVRVTARPGSTAEATVQFTNITTTQTNTILIEPLAMSQGSEGQWLPADNPQILTAADVARSCLAWTSIEPAAVEVAPFGAKPVSLRFAVPKGAKGTYYMMFIARVKAPQPKPGQLGLTLRFLVPVLVTVDAGTVAQQVALGDTQMLVVPPTDKRPSLTQLALTAENSGETYQEVSGSVTVMRSVEGAWRRVTEVPIRTRYVLPGHSVTMGEVINRRFPAGSYQLRARLGIAGRVVDRKEVVVDFAGDPTATRLVADVELSLQPNRLVAETLPGGVRSFGLTVTNGSDEPVDCEPSAALPGAMALRILNNVKGEDFDASKWIEFSPTKGRVPAQGRRTFRVTVRMPADPGSKARYYSAVTIRARAETGEVLGQALADLELHNKASKATPTAAPSSLELQQTAPGRYVVTSVFANTGELEYEATCNLALMSGKLQVVQSVPMTAPTERILPLAAPPYTAEIDLSAVPAGVYVLQAALTYATTERCVYERRLEVSRKDGKLQVNLLPETAEQGE